MEMIKDTWKYVEFCSLKMQTKYCLPFQKKKKKKKNQERVVSQMNKLIGQSAKRYVQKF